MTLQNRLQKRFQRQTSSSCLEELKVLTRNLVPITLEQAEWICNEVETILRKHPELAEKMEEWENFDEDMEDIQRIVVSILKRMHLEHESD